MKTEIDLYRLCDGLNEEFYQDLESETGESGTLPLEEAKRIKGLVQEKIQLSGQAGYEDKEMKKPMRRISHKMIVIAAVIAVLTTSAFAAGGMDFFRSLFGDSVARVENGIQQVGIAAEDEVFRVTAEQLISDGLNTKIIVALEPLTKEAEKWAAEPENRPVFSVDSGEESGESMTMTSVEPLSQFNETGRYYYCVSYVSDKDYTGKPLSLAFEGMERDLDEGSESGDAVLKSQVSLVIENPESMRASRTVQLSGAETGTESESAKPLSLTVNSISAVLNVQDLQAGETPTFDVVLVMKDGSKEAVFEAGWVDEEATGGGGAFLSGADSLVCGYQYRRNLETGSILQTAEFSEIIDVNEVDYVLVAGERFDFD